MKRIHLKKRRKISKPNKITILIICIVIAIILMFRFINKRVSPLLTKYATMQANKIATNIVRRSVSDKVTKNFNVDDLFIITKDTNGNIRTIDFNPITVNKVLNKVTETVNDYLTHVEQKEFQELSLKPTKDKQGIVFQIPSGAVFKNALLSNIGPKIPVKLILIGDIDSDIKTSITNYGINNAILKVSVYVHVKEEVILPISSKQVDINMNVPIAIKAIQGEIPEYYLSGIKTTNSLSVPVK